MGTPPTGRIKDPLHGCKNIMGAPHMELGDGKVNHHLRNVSTQEEMILVPLETHTGIGGNKEDILPLAPVGALHMIDMAWSSHFVMMIIGTLNLDMNDPHMTDHNTISPPKDPLHKRRGFPPNISINLTFPLAQTQVHQNDTLTMLHQTKQIKGPQ